MADVSKLKLGSTTYDIKSKTGTATTALYGICTTAAATAAKEVIIVDPTVTRTDLLAAGTILHVKFSNANTVANPTLTVFNNSGTAASPTKGSTTLMAQKAIMRYGTTTTSTNANTSWRAGAIVALVYDGTNWIEVTAIDDNTTYSNMSLGSAFCTSTTTADTVAKVATPVNGTCSLVSNGIVSVRFTEGNTAASPTLNVSSKGAKPIWYRGAAPTANNAGKLWKAGDTVTFYYDNTRYNIVAVENSDIVQDLNNSMNSMQNQVQDWISDLDDAIKYVKKAALNNLTAFEDVDSIGFGDSNMAGTYFDEEYESTRNQCIYGQICNMLGCTYNNRGVNGAHFETDSTKYHNTWLPIKAEIDEADPDDNVGLVVVVGGINDYHYADIDYSHFISCVRTCVIEILEKFPKAVVLLIWDQGRQDANYSMLRYARGLRVVATDLSAEYARRIVAPFTSDLFMEYNSCYYNQNHFNPTGTKLIATRAVNALFGVNNSAMCRRTVLSPESGFSNCTAIVKTEIDAITFVRTDYIDVYFNTNFAYSGGTNIPELSTIFKLPSGFDSNQATGPYENHPMWYDCLSAMSGNNNTPSVAVQPIPIRLSQDNTNYQSVTASPELDFQVVYKTPVSWLSSHRTNYHTNITIDPRTN